MSVKTSLFLAILIAIGGHAGALAAEASAEWGYHGHLDPAHWGTQFAACNGKNQSPIDLTAFVEAELPPLIFDDRAPKAGQQDIVNNGHTVQIDDRTGSTLAVDGQVFTLKQFHFHTPSENHIDGQSYPLEGHFVHADEAGNLAVVAVMYQEGPENAAFAPLWAAIPPTPTPPVALNPGVAAASLLPSHRDYYRFNGSLTTPPCTEGVRWLVMKTPVFLSNNQVQTFARVLAHPNNRPLQAVNARPVLK